MKGKYNSLCEQVTYGRRQGWKKVMALLAGVLAVAGAGAAAGVTKADSPAGPSAAGMDSVQNPRIVAGAEDPGKMAVGETVTWDCVWFGSYPQTEVISVEDTNAINALDSRAQYYEIEYEKMEGGSWSKLTGDSVVWDGNGDATVDGVKYRRVKQGDATYSINDNGYYNWLDSTSYHYFRYEPIRWRVLSVDGNDAFLLADQGLDDRRYNERENDMDVTWETSTIRSWLNGYGASENTYQADYSGTGSRNFFDAAFSSEEQEAIYAADLANADNSEYGTKGGNNTADKIFLLSESETWGSGAEKYGFVADKTTWDAARRANSTTYAKAMGVWSNYDSNQGLGYEYRGSTCWWLRSPGSFSGAVSDVHRYGYGDSNGSNADLAYYTVRPALHLNLSSFLYTNAGTVSVQRERKLEPTAPPTAAPARTPRPTKAPGQDEDLHGADGLSDEIGEFREGARAKVGKAVYRVTNASKREVEYLGVAKDNAARLTVPGTVTVNVNGRAVRCKVTGIGKNAFRGKQRLKVVVLGANIRRIKKGAFVGCKNLRKIIIKSKRLNQVAQNAFQGISRQCKIMVPGSRFHKYKKLFRKKGLLKPVKIVRIVK